jgi:hypothetical protein
MTTLKQFCVNVRNINPRARTTLTCMGLVILLGICIYRAGSSPEGQAATRAAVAREQAAQAKQALADMAKSGCRQTVQLNEDFPSTVDFNWFGTTLIHRPQSASYNVMVDYTAKNSTGATLPYTMLCWSDDAGNIVEHQRAGR